MTKFIVRVELRNSESANYDKLHEAMLAADFFRFDNFDEQNYQLPNGEYVCYQGRRTIAEIARSAKSIAEKIKPNPKILVTESAEFFQLGLDKF